jgi:exodeoxyribonuclease-5
MKDITLNEGQQRALEEILRALRPSTFHCLTGYAGSGKTTLMEVLAKEVLALHKTIIMTAPTHKAVSVLSRKLQDADICGVPCVTIHSLLSLSPKKPRGDRLIFERKKRADPVMQDVVVIDECSMVSEDLLVHIRRHLQESFVLFVGDPAQLPPVNEEASQTFSVRSRSHLDTIVRQGAGNPILDAAHAIRESQGKEMDWSWCVQAKANPFGVFLPGSAGDTWLHKGFTSSEFSADPDTFRYLCWTNARVDQVNRKVRHWIYGDNIPTPFMPGERALIRSPIVQKKTILFNTNEEATVLSMEPDTFLHHFEAFGDLSRWIATVPSWSVKLRKDDGTVHEVHMIRDDGAYNQIIARIADEATDCRDRWADHHSFKSALARLQSVYAMTTHTSQGSTFKNCFVDIGDIRRRAASNLLETQQLLYVAVTRPTHALILLGV